MKLSIVVVVYNMRRAAPRTLLSLSPSYQRGVAAADCEVIVVENGSSEPLDPDAVRALGPGFRYFFLPDAGSSPAPAVNFGLRAARGEHVGVLIDGARITTPGLFEVALRALAAHPAGVVCTTGWTLGRDPQNLAVARGFDEAKEDALLAHIAWPTDPYRLFEIATLDGSSALLGPIAESNALFMRRARWDELGGMDERFDQPGGGFVNLDTLERALGLPAAEMVLLLGEATFHQVHGGISTNSLPHQLASDLEQWHIHYQNLRQQDWRLPNPHTTYFGKLPSAYRAHLVEWGNQQTLARVKSLRGELEHLHERVVEATRRADATEAAARAAAQAAAAELGRLRDSLAFRVAHAASRRYHALAPEGTRRGRAGAHGRALLRWAARWRRAPASAGARAELRAVLAALQPGTLPAPEIRHVLTEGPPPAFALDEWEETPFLYQSEIDTLLPALWESVGRTRGPGPA